VAVDDGFAGTAGEVALGAKGLEVHNFAVVGVAGFAGGEIGHGGYIGRGGGIAKEEADDCRWPQWQEIRTSVDHTP
jgi:hypothetical protein